MNHAANLSNPVVQILPPVRILPLITSEGEDLTHLHPVTFGALSDVLALMATSGCCCEQCSKLH